MTKPHCKPTTFIDQDNITHIINQAFKEAAAQIITAKLIEDITFLTGAISCVAKMEDKSKIPEALELCIDLLRDMYGEVNHARN